MNTPDLAATLKEMGRQARQASHALAALDTETKNRILHAVADGLAADASEILEANARDLASAEEQGLSAALVDRLRLDQARLDRLADDVRDVALLEDPVGEELDRFRGADDIDIRKVRVPIGVVAIIFESRPNVTVDAAVLCLKAGNAVILRGGREAFDSNMALASVLAQAGGRAGLPPQAVQIVPVTDREAVPLLCGMDDHLDLVIPRGGRGLIEAVVGSARVPVIKHDDGICHVYLDRGADPAMAESIVVNAKCQRPGVCNAAETLLVHAAAAPNLLPQIARTLVRDHAVELRVDDRTAALLDPDLAAKPATEEDWRTEYLDLILSIRIVNSLDEAVDHINRFGSGHSDAIVTSDEEAARAFLQRVDSAAVYWNASTRYTDGGQFGFGAEIGISTDKLHARGPVGLPELTSYKYLVTGHGQIR